MSKKIANDPRFGIACRTLEAFSLSELRDMAALAGFKPSKNRDENIIALARHQIDNGKSDFGCPEVLF